MLLSTQSDRGKLCKNVFCKVFQIKQVGILTLTYRLLASWFICFHGLLIVTGKLLLHFLTYVFSLLTCTILVPVLPFVKKNCFLTYSGLMTGMDLAKKLSNALVWIMLKYFWHLFIVPCGHFPWHKNKCQQFNCSNHMAFIFNITWSFSRLKTWPWWHCHVGAT